MSTNPIMTTIIISIVANVCVNSSDCGSTTTTIVSSGLILLLLLVLLVLLS